jgi:hypothetical protein
VYSLEDFTDVSEENTVFHLQSQIVRQAELSASLVCCSTLKTGVNTFLQNVSILLPGYTV